MFVEPPANEVAKYEIKNAGEYYKLRIILVNFLKNLKKEDLGSVSVRQVMRMLEEEHNISKESLGGSSSLVKTLLQVILMLLVDLFNFCMSDKL